MTKTSLKSLSTAKLRKLLHSKDLLREQRNQVYNELLKRRHQR